MSKKTLIIYDSIEYFMELINKYDGVNAERLYCKRNIAISAVKKLFLRINVFNKAWYGDWINNISYYSVIVIFATRDYTFIRWIRDNYPDVKIIFWYWNPVYRVGLPKKELYNLCRIWSFDLLDCKRYDLKFNSTFYFKNIKLPVNKIEFDVLFLGIDKGRRKELNEYKAVLDSLGLDSFFHIVPDKKDSNIFEERPISYPNYLELVSKSRAILDIKPMGQDGLTLRPMEALFLRKKLITTDLNIIEQKFYNENNIFVMGKDKISKLPDFLISPYVHVNQDIVDFFDFGNWLKRMT